MVEYIGDFAEDATVYVVFNTFTSDDPSASCTITNFINTDVHIHKNNDLTQRNNAAGITVSVDFDGITGSHMVVIDTSDDTVGGFWVTGADYFVRIEGTTVDGATINSMIKHFSIENRFNQTVVPDAAGVAPTAAEVVNEWETQSQADPTGFHVNVMEWLSQVAAAVSVNGVPEVDITHIGGNSIAGNAATLTLKQLDIQNNAGSALIAKATGGNGHGVEAAGNGTGEGINALGGATGHGIEAKGGATSGHGVHALGSATEGDGLHAEAASEGDGIAAIGKGTAEHGILAQGGDTSGDGIHAEADSEGDGITAIGKGTDEHGILARGGDTSGDGIHAEAATSGDGIAAVGATNGHGVNADGAGSGEGISATGGTGGDGIGATGGSTSGHGINALGGNSGAGINAIGTNVNAGINAAGHGANSGILATGGADGDGLTAKGGGSTGSGFRGIAQADNHHGMELTKHGTGKDIDADEIAAIKAETALIVADTNELQTDDVPTLIAALPTAVEIQTELEENGASFLDSIKDLLEHGTYGLAALKAAIDAIAASALLTAEIATVTDQTHFTLATGSDVNDAYTNMGVVLYDDSNSDYPCVRKATDYVGATKTLTIDSAPNFTLGTDDSVLIFSVVPGGTAPTVGEIQAELEENGASYLDTIKDMLENGTYGLSALEGLVDDIPGDVGTALATYDPPTRAELTTDKNSIITEVNANETKIDTLQTGLDDVPTVAEFEARSDLAGTAATPAEVATALTTYDGPTRAEATTDKDAIITEVNANETKIDAIQTDLDNAVDGLGALKILIDAIQADLDNGTDGLGALKALIDAAKAVIDDILLDTGTDGVVLKAAGLAADAIDEFYDEVIEGTVTHRQAMRIMLSALTGISTGGGTADLKSRDIADSKNRVELTVDANGNRSASTLDGS